MNGFKSLCSMLLLSFGCAIGAAAQQNGADNKILPDVEMTATSRIYYPDRMNFPENTPILDVMLAIVDGRTSNPEQIVRDYRIMIAGSPIMQDNLYFLSSLKVVDVVSITYNNNFTVFEGNQGLLGTINIELRPHTKGIHGFADMSVSSKEENHNTAQVKFSNGTWDVMGNISWRKLSGEQFTHDYVVADGDTHKTVSDQDVSVNRFVQDFFIKANYTDKKRNFVSLFFSQEYGHKTDMETYTNDIGLPKLGYVTSPLNNRNQIYTFNMVWEYKLMPKTVFVGFLIENFGRNKNKYDDWYSGGWLDHFNFDKLTNDNKMKNDMHLGEMRIISNDIKNTSLSFGYRYTFENTHADNAYFTNGGDELQQKYCLHSALFSPYATATYRFGNFNVSGGYRLNLKRYDARLDEDPHWNHSYRNSMWEAMAGWDINKNSHLVAAYSHRIQEQMINQVFPESIYTVGDGVTDMLGNENLKLPTFDVFDLSYSRNSSNCSLLLKARYYQGRNALYLQPMKAEIIDGTNYYYAKWENAEKDNGVIIDGELNIHRKWFGCTFAAAYNYIDHANLHKEKSCMLRVMPVLTLPYGFNINGVISYHTSADTPILHTDDFWYGRLRVSNTIGRHWNIYAQWENPFQSKIYTETKGDGNTSFHTQLLSDSQATFGVYYNF